MTQEDKYWLIGGLTLVGVGTGIYIYKQAKAKKDEEEAALYTQSQNQSISVSETTEPSLSNTPYNGSNQSVNTSTPTVSAVDKFTFIKGQKVQANLVGGQVIGHQTIKDANGTYQQKVDTKTGRLIEVKKFDFGSEIGTIIDVRNNKAKNKKIYYVQTSSGVLVFLNGGNEFYPIGKLLVPAKTIPAGLDVNKVLKKGIYDSKEVEQLQKYLGFTGKNVDGDFGSMTETALYKAKGVKQIALKDWK